MIDRYKQTDIDRYLSISIDRTDIRYQERERERLLKKRETFIFK